MAVSCHTITINLFHFSRMFPGKTLQEARLGERQEGHLRKSPHVPEGRLNRVYKLRNFV
jgi:hypothetical protein